MRSRTQNCKGLWLYWLGDNVMEKACLCGLFITSMITRRWLSQSWLSWLSWWWSRRWWWWTPNCQGRHTSAANHAPLTTWWTVPFNLCNHHYQHYIHHSWKYIIIIINIIFILLDCSWKYIVIIINIIFIILDCSWKYIITIINILFFILTVLRNI